MSKKKIELFQSSDNQDKDHNFANLDEQEIDKIIDGVEMIKKAFQKYEKKNNK